MNFIIENWPLLAAGVVVVASAVIAFAKFCKSDKATQIANLKEWLLYATALAEKELGGGTGKLKLRFVYDMFVVKFPWLAKLISFERFSEYVDEALESMNKLLETNEAVSTYVKGE